MDALTPLTTELLQQMIRNACVNDGTSESGFEFRSADLLETFLEGSGLDVQRYPGGPQSARHPPDGCPSSPASTARTGRRRASA